jgi:glucose 1-dehydrogenase
MSGLKLAGRVAIVTGGARGIGGASAVELAANGADVVIGDLKPREDAAAVIDRIEACGRRAIYIQGDASDKRVDALLVESAVKECGRVDIVLNNVAKVIRGPFIDLEPEDARKVMDVVFWAGYQLSQLAARQMIRQGWGGSIVFISSVHAVHHFAHSIALELAPHRIRVNWIEPGWIDTPGEHIAFGDEFLKREGAKLLWGRMGRPEEIAKGVLFLASDDSSYMTGAALRLDGGYVLPAADAV